MNEAGPGPARGRYGEARAADIDAHEFLKGVVRRDERGGVDDDVDAGGRPLPRRRVGNVSDDRLGAERFHHVP